MLVTGHWSTKVGDKCTAQLSSRPVQVFLCKGDMIMLDFSVNRKHFLLHIHWLFCPIQHYSPTFLPEDKYYIYSCIVSISWYEWKLNSFKLYTQLNQTARHCRCGEPYLAMLAVLSTIFCGWFLRIASSQRIECFCICSSVIQIKR